MERPLERSKDVLRLRAKKETMEWEETLLRTLIEVLSDFVLPIIWAR